MRKIVLTFGLISGVSLSAFLAAPFLLTDSSQIDHGLAYGYATMVLSMLLIYFGVRQYRDNLSGGTVSFGKAFQVGFLIFLVAGLCYVVTWEVLYRTVASGFVADYANQTIERLRASGATEAQVAAQQAEMAKFAEWYQNPILRAGMTFLEPLPVGLIFALLSAWVLSRRKVATA